MTTTAALFRPEWAHGQRAVTGQVGVDSGTMCIATTFPDDGSWMPAAGDADAWCGPGWVCSTSGYGDGGYEVLTLTDDGAVTGVEVMFLSAAVDAAADADLAATGVPEPDRTDVRAVLTKKADAATTERVNAWYRLSDQVTQQAWERLAATIDPASESVPQVIGELTVPEAAPVLRVGDPCYRGATLLANVPAGRYIVVAWGADAGPWGERTARLGAYRIR